MQDCQSQLFDNKPTMKYRYVFPFYTNARHHYSLTVLLHGNIQGHGGPTGKYIWLKHVTLVSY